MSTDYAIAGEVTFPNKRAFDAFVTAHAKRIGEWFDADIQWVRLDAVIKRRVVRFGGHIEKSVYFSDVAPELIAIFGDAQREGGRGSVWMLDVSGEGRRFDLVDEGVGETRLSENAATREYASMTFRAVRTRLARAARKRETRGDRIANATLKAPRNLAEARLVLEHGHLPLVGETDGVTAARLLLDKDGTPNAVHRVVDAIARKWSTFGSAMFSGSQEGMTSAVLVHHPHAHIADVCAARLETLKASEAFSKKTPAALRLAEGLSFVLERRRA